MDDPALQTAEFVLAISGEQIFDRHTRCCLNFEVAIDEGHFQDAGDLPSDGRFSSTHHSDQHNRSPAQVTGEMIVQQ